MALTEDTQLSLHLSHSDLAGEHTIAVTQSQLNKLNRAKEAGKGVNIKMSKTQVRHNMKVHGGILSLLAGLASQALPFITGTVLPAFGVGALSLAFKNLWAMACTSKKRGAYTRSKRMENVCFPSPQIEKFLLNTAMVYI